MLVILFHVEILCCDYVVLHNERIATTLVASVYTCMFQISAFIIYDQLIYTTSFK